MFASWRQDSQSVAKRNFDVQPEFGKDCDMSTCMRLLGVAVVLALVPAGNAQVLYKVENVATGTAHEIFNNSQGSETESCWVANSFQVVAGGTDIQSISFLLGNVLTNQSATISIYTGTSLTNPQAGGGLVRVSSTTTTLTAAADTFQTINLSSPISLPVGQIFYAALLLPNIPGNVFPFASDAGSTPAVTPLGRSFFDVGPTQGAPYNLDDTSRATLLGASHPVVSFAQSPGNLSLRVNAVPEPSSMALLGVAISSVGMMYRRRKAKLSAC